MGKQTATVKKETVQVSVGKDSSTITFGDTKVEVSADGKKVTAYSNDSVEVKTTSGATAAGKGTQINVSADFNTVVLKGVVIWRAADGHLVISAPGTVITKPGPVNDSKKEPEPGDKMEDGTIYAGISPDTGEALYVMPQDSPGTLKWKAAMKYAAGLDAAGLIDWRLPTKAELNVLYENRDKGALKGTFNETGSYPAGWYWSSTEPSLLRGPAWPQRFSDGCSVWHSKGNDFSVRAVRSEPTRPVPRT